MSTFNRDDYYSITDVLRRYKISRAKYHKLIKERNLPIHNVFINMGNYTMTAQYVKKSIIDSLGIELR